MRPLITLTCADFRNQGLIVGTECCSSCHMDDDDYGMLEVYPASRDGKCHDYKIMAEVCCNMADVIFELPRAAWADIIKNKRSKFPKTFEAEWLE